MKNELADLSRRSFFKQITAYALGAALTVGLIPNLSFAQTKMTQKDAAYQDTPKGTKSCSNCSLFEAPSGCKIVEGKVSPQGWCSVFTPKV
jgi:anaerobic selenocysteine-containing dehydrogenase